MNPRSLIHTLGVLAGLSTLAPLARAADTVEPWDEGYADVDHYWGYDGIGLYRSERGVYGDMMLGWGVGHTLSPYLGMTMAGDGALNNLSVEPYLGVYGTPLDTDHMDLDLFMDFGPGDGALAITPAFELNLDLAPDQADCGLYLRTGFPITGRTNPADPDDPGKTVFAIEPLLGFYKTFGDSQVLVEVDMTIRPDAAEGERDTEIGGVALGFNYTLSDTVELINQVAMDVPQGDEKVSFGVFTGFIATLGHDHD